MQTSHCNNSRPARILSASAPRTQGGAALLVALILLIVLSMLGVSGGMKSQMQEKMAGNTHNRDMALQAAEYALAEADEYMNDSTKIPALRGLDCATDTPPDNFVLCETNTATLHDNDADYWKSHALYTCGTNTKSVTIDDSTFRTALDAAPCYVIERLPDGTVDEPGSPCPSAGADICKFYRVTARGRGGVSHSPVILQSMYRFDP